MNIIMKIWKRKTLEDEYNDLTNCTLDVTKMYYGETYESIIKLAALPYFENLIWLSAFKFCLACLYSFLSSSCF